ncbi:unnamed protein product [Caenorhabditis brenneri]
MIALVKMEDGIVKRPSALDEKELAIASLALIYGINAYARHSSSSRKSTESTEMISFKKWRDWKSWPRFAERCPRSA